MPEYLSPGVYVEEIDSGSKPIEGVSTSTAGMVGLAERGPVGPPIPITSFSEYTRIFGGYLNRLDFGDHAYLPHAVEGFFTNGGKRVFIVRALEVTAAAAAETKLFDREAKVSASTQLLSDVSTSPGTDTAFVIDNTGLGVTVPPTWVQIGDGSTAEFRKVVAPTGTDDDITLQTPLSFGYDNGVSAVQVDHLSAGFASGGTVDLEAEVEPGTLALQVSGAGVINAGTVLRLGSAAAGDEEYVVADAPPATAAPAARTVVLRTSVQLAHAKAVAAVAIFNDLPALPLAAAPAFTDNRTTLSLAGAQLSAGRQSLLLTAPAAFGTAGDLLLISDGVHAEIRKIGALGSLTLAVPAYADYPAGTIIDSVTLADDGASATLALAADAEAGATVLDLLSRTGLVEGGVIRIGLAGDPQAEFITIKRLPEPQAAPNAGKVILATPLATKKAKPSEVHLQTPPPATAPGATSLVVPSLRGSTALVAGLRSYAAGAFLRVRLGPAAVVYHRLAAAAGALDAKPLTLDSPLLLPHAAGETVAARTPLLTVRALDQGAWGNRLRVSVKDSDPPLCRSSIRVLQDSTHLKLKSANGVEAGTILRRVDAAGHTLSSHKVKTVERQKDFLITLETGTPLPAGTAVGEGVMSQEFQIDVFLLRQPDDAVPTRSESVLQHESFRALSLDPRHSRYVEKVIGTTWQLNADEDDALPPLPLRLWDRRSEGESACIRIYDLAKDGASPSAIQAALESLRMGPEALVDELPDGRTVPARFALTGGDDAIPSVADATLLGADDPDPHRRTGLFSLRSQEEVSIIGIPGHTSIPIQEGLIDQCESMRSRFAVLDARRPPDDSLSDVQAQRQQFDTKYAALYHPWLLIPDPFPANLAKIADYPIPPSGHMMGVYARTDEERGVHKAPANEVVNGITGLQRLLNKGEQDFLNPYPVNINVIRDFRPNQRGLRVWGARVITSDPDWKYVPVRRLFIFIEQSLDRGLQWVVFEPNAEPLWARVRRSVGLFLKGVWRDGALEGTKPEEAYFVKVDHTTMTQADIDNGRLIVVIGVAPVKPAEFVIIRIGLWTANADA